MATDYFEIAGQQVPSSSLKIERAKDFALLVESGATPNAQIIGCYVGEDGTESVVLSVRPTVPQRPKVQIERIEFVSLTFRLEDNKYPDVRALRVNFPRERVLHLNGGIPPDQPASLCLFAEPWADVRLRLTANELLFRLQNWFDDSASGKLHREDQPLEPAFIARANTLILSDSVLDFDPADETEINLNYIPAPDHTVFVEHREDRTFDAQLKPALVLKLVSEPHEHTVVNDAPKNLHDLDEVLKPVGINLTEYLQRKLLELEADLDKFGFLVLLIVLLRKRDASSDPEPELVSFSCIPPNAGLRGILKDIGFTGTDYDPGKTGKNVLTHFYSARFVLTSASASFFSGHKPTDSKLVGVGTGSIGSQVVMNCVRGGLTKWTLIDHDLVLPHNLVRHSLGGFWLGNPKATAVAWEANTIIDKPEVKPIVADVLNPQQHEADIVEAYGTADAIVDFSASVAVAKHLAVDVKSSARRCSIFVSPSGQDLVFVGEDKERNITLDSIESQYFRAVANEAALAGHLAGGSTAGSCREITSRVPQCLMSIHAGQAERLLRLWLQNDEPMATVVRAENEGCGFSHHTLLLGNKILLGKLGDWTLYTDSIFVETLHKIRSGSLPDETGGVLLGHVDAQRKSIYVCHQIPAPEDSERQPTVYIRGCKGLLEEYNHIRSTTAENLAYVGEWHSHPDNSKCEPSDVDILACGLLAQQGRHTSLPALMLILGENASCCWILCSQSNEDGSLIKLHFSVTKEAR